MLSQLCPWQSSIMSPCPKSQLHFFWPCLIYWSKQHFKLLLPSILDVHVSPWFTLCSVNTLFFAGPCILFHPSNWLNTILNRQLVYQSQISLRTSLSGVSLKLLDECAYWLVLQQGLPIISDWRGIYISFRRKKRQKYVFARETPGLLNPSRINHFLRVLSEIHQFLTSPLPIT